MFDCWSYNSASSTLIHALLDLAAIWGQEPMSPDGENIP